MINFVVFIGTFYMKIYKAWFYTIKDLLFFSYKFYRNVQINW